MKTVLKDGGVAIMSTGYGKGESRVSQAINDALHSPLLNLSLIHIYGSDKRLVQGRQSNLDYFPVSLSDLYRRGI